jgi:hypothetical protein
MSRGSVVFHSTLSPGAIADTLQRSIAPEGVPRYLKPWFVRLVQRGDSRPVCGTVDSSAFRLRRQAGGQYSPNLYAKWVPENTGTRIEGYFDLAPVVRLAVRLTSIVVLGFAVLGIVLNLLDLKAGTHFTKDPDVGLVLSVLFIPFGIGFFLLAQRLGSRSDETLLSFVELTLAATRVSEPTKALAD